MALTLPVSVNLKTKQKLDQNHKLGELHKGPSDGISRNGEVIIKEMCDLGGKIFLYMDLKWQFTHLHLFQLC